MELALHGGIDGPAINGEFRIATPMNLKKIEAPMNGDGPGRLQGMTAF
jgi:hypothetical protein